ncbi:MAG TPA: hypothetical protein VG106_00035 [Vicinamibacterales bacterium]|nr:hypothetical protein [Vicinamibacterales bacterium]
MIPARARFSAALKNAIDFRQVARATDKEILPTWADWVAGRDPVLEWIMKQ